MPKFITIIDDDSEDIDFLRSAILAADPSVKCVAFTSVEEAIAHMSTDRVAPDVVFVDYNMPVLNGIECLQIFNALRVLNYTSYVAISSEMPPALEQAFLSNGAYCAFEKPTTMQGYAKLIEQVLSNTYGVQSS